MKPVDKRIGKGLREKVKPNPLITDHVFYRSIGVCAGVLSAVETNVRFEAIAKMKLILGK